MHNCHISNYRNLMYILCCKINLVNFIFLIFRSACRADPAGDYVRRAAAAARARVWGVAATTAGATTATVYWQSGEVLLTEVTPPPA